jgi:hypothetical protein
LHAFQTAARRKRCHAEAAKNVIKHPVHLAMQCKPNPGQDGYEQVLDTAGARLSRAPKVHPDWLSRRAEKLANLDRIGFQALA